MTSQERELDNQDKSPVTEKKNIWQGIKDNGTTVGIALALAFLIRLFIAEPRYIPSDSMLPTLLQGDRLVIEKVAYKFRSPVRGEIVVFQPPEQLQVLGYTKNQAFIKRAIATGGDTVAVKKGLVYVNNEPLQENYIAQPPDYDMPAVTVPQGELFVMGDNRNNSNDSHIWGFLPEKNLIGHAIFRFFPFDRLGTI